MSDSVRPHRRQPTRLFRPWDFSGRNTGVGYHFLLQCMKVKSKCEVAQSCPTLHDPMDCSLPGSSVHGIFQARVLEWVAIAFSRSLIWDLFYFFCIDLMQILPVDRWVYCMFLLGFSHPHLFLQPQPHLFLRPQPLAQWNSACSYLHLTLSSASISASLRWKKAKLLSHSYKNVTKENRVPSIKL